MIPRMVEYNVLVDPDPVHEKTKGGLYIADETREKHKHGQMFGTLVALSPMAFAFDDWPDGVEKPKEGDRVMFAKHAGTFADLDGHEYRVIKDRDIVAVLA